MQLYFICTFGVFAISYVLADFKYVRRCGETKTVSEVRIVGGTDASRGMQPWAAILGYDIDKNSNPRRKWLCGGSLITNKHVLTAAHCISIKDYRLSVVRFGDLFYKKKPSKGAIDIPVKKAIIHENFESQSNIEEGLFNDIAIIYLVKAVVFTDLIIPICLPYKKNLNIDNQAHTVLTAGWGYNKTYNDKSRSDRLKVARVNIIPNKICKKNYKKVNTTILSSHICAGTTIGVDSCRGDSGGPLVLRQGNKHILIGITSDGHECALKEYPGIYTRVSSYLEWIHSHINNSCCIKKNNAGEIINWMKFLECLYLER